MATETRQREMVLAPNEFAFVLDRTTGQVNVFRGPHKEALSADFRPVIWKSGRFMEAGVPGEENGGHFSDAIMSFVKATEVQYVVLRNPPKTQKEMQSGKNGAIALDTGKTVVMRGPVEFPLWPGQEAEVIDGHQLDEDQYLKIRVTGPIAEEDAEKLWSIVREEWREEKDNESALNHFPLGAEFVVRGAKISFFIPPTGITVLSKNSEKEHYRRSGVKLAADQYVQLVNRVGRISHVYGPTTVIPCTDQEFKLNPETNGAVFEAVAIDENSGVLLQTLAEMTADEARKRVPGAQVLVDRDENAKLPPGTQLVVWKKNMLVFPADGIEIVRKFGACHIQAGTARYVKNLQTGKTRVVQGEVLHLADPRVEEFVERVLTPEQITLWFPNGGYDPKLVPCITVPQGTAAMVLGVGHDGQVTRQKFIGHKIYFLQWDEILAVLKVSGSKPGQPKDWKNAIRVCYLWTTGNRINDCMNGRSRDDCEFVLEYTLNVDFDLTKSDDWFNVDDYVYLVCEEVRSRLLGALLAYPINDIATNFVGLVRDLVLGKKEGAPHRPGLEFTRCGARLVDINVKSFKISDPQLETSLKKLQQAAVNDSIKTRESETMLDGELKRLTIELQRLEADVKLKRARAEATVQATEVAEEQQRRTEAAKRQTAEDKLKIERELLALQLAADKAKLELKHANEKLVNVQNDELKMMLAETRRKVAEVDTLAAEFQSKGQLILLAPDQARAKQRLEDLIAETGANAEAIAKVNASIVPQIAADLRLLADSNMASRVAEALGRTATFRGMDMMELLAQLAGGSPVVSRALEALKIFSSGNDSQQPALPAKRTDK